MEFSESRISVVNLLLSRMQSLLPSKKVFSVDCPGITWMSIHKGMNLDLYVTLSTIKMNYSPKCKTLKLSEENRDISLQKPWFGQQFTRCDMDAQTTKAK